MLAAETALIVGFRNATGSQIDMCTITANKLATAWDEALLDNSLPACRPGAMEGDRRDFIRFGDGLPE